MDPSLCFSATNRANRMNQPETLAALTALIVRLAEPAGTPISRGLDYWEARCLLRKLALASFDSVVDTSAPPGPLNMTSAWFKEIAADITLHMETLLGDDRSG